MTSDIMRRYLNIVDRPNDELDRLFAMPLTESRALNEGLLGDRVRAAMSRVAQRFGKASPQVLDQVAGRAESLYSGNETVGGVIARAKALGRSPALLAAMVGICGALISLSPNPAAAQEAAQSLQPILTMQDVDQIVDLLAQHNITIKPDAGAKVQLPGGLSPMVAKAAQALKAISDFQFVEGGRMESTRELQNSISLEAGIKREGARFAESVSLWTSDHKVLIADFSTVFEVRDGQPALVEETSSGLRPELIKAFAGLPEETQNKVSAYINQNGSEVDEGIDRDGPITKMVQRKGRDLCLLIAQYAVRGDQVASRVRIGPRGVQVS